MRVARVLFTAAAAIAATTVVAPAASAIPIAPFTAFTIDGAADNATFARDDVFDGTAGTTVTVAAGTPSQLITFTGAAPADPANQGGAHVSVDASHTTLAVGTFPVSTFGATGTVAITLGTDSWGNDCHATDGTLTVAHIDTDGTGAVNALAADYSVVCSGSQLSGELRWNAPAANGYDAVAANVRSWDFGDSYSPNHNGIAKTITFTNRGTRNAALGVTSLAGDVADFGLSSATACATTLTPGQSCSVTITPHPAAADYSLSSANLLVASSTPGIASRVVPLTATGSPTPALYVVGGPERALLFWGALPKPAGAPVDTYSLYRGDSAAGVKYLKRVPATSTIDSGLTGGHTYYYAVRPIFANGKGGDLTPAVAVKPWPKYSAGMYHRLSTPARFAAGHKVVAGHPYTLQIDGGHGLPSSHVSAVALNVLAANPTQDTSVTVYPTGSSQPAQPDLVAQHGTTRSNFALVKVGTNGRITIATSHGTTPVFIDVTGYYSATGLSTSYGTGGATHTYVKPGTVLDTKADTGGALAHDFFVDAPVNFDPQDTPHITSLIVQITAYGSSGSGTLAAFPSADDLDNVHVPPTSVLAYRPYSTTSNLAIVSAGRLTLAGTQYPSIGILNRGSRPVQLFVTIVGYVDDDTFMYGERYTPTTPVHLSMSSPLYNGSVRTITPGSHAGTWTTAMNVKISASAPTATTTLSLWPKGFSGVGAPAHGQLHANANQTTMASTLAPMGIPTNQFYLRDIGGKTYSNIWSFGVFNQYPVPTDRNYTGTGLSVRRAALSPATLAAGRHRIAFGTN